MAERQQIQLTLIDRNAELVDAWREAFADCPDVTIKGGDIFGHTLVPRVDAVISPANSFGYMDGGIDLLYRDRFGLHLEADVMACVRAMWGGVLPVGKALVVHTHEPGNGAIPYLVVAPTMEVPGMDVSLTDNAKTAFRAAIAAVHDFNRDRAVRRGVPYRRPLPYLEPKFITHILSPGLCTATGRMSPRAAAIQMSAAWREAGAGGVVA